MSNMLADAELSAILVTSFLLALKDEALGDDQIERVIRSTTAYFERILNNPEIPVRPQGPS